MAGLANLFIPSTDTIRGISDRTGMNLPDLPYGGIMSLLTGGPIGLAAHYAANNVIPAIANAVNPDVGELMYQRAPTNDYLLDKVFGNVELPDNFPYLQAMGVDLISSPEFAGGQYDPNSMQNYGINIDNFPNPAFDMPSFDMPDFGQFNFEAPVYDFGDFNAPSFDFGGYEAPVYDYGDFDFRRGGKV
jgi:hypothetical protein